MSQIDVEVLDKLPHTAIESNRSKLAGKFRVIYETLAEHTRDKTYFIKVSNLDKGGVVTLKTQLKKKFGAMWDVLKDEYSQTTFYIRKNPYKGGNDGV